MNSIHSLSFYFQLYAMTMPGACDSMPLTSFLLQTQNFDTLTPLCERTAKLRKKEKRESVRRWTWNHKTICGIILFIQSINVASKCPSVRPSIHRQPCDVYFILAAAFKLCYLSVRLVRLSVGVVVIFPPRKKQYKIQRNFWVHFMHNLADCQMMPKNLPQKKIMLGSLRTLSSIFSPQRKRIIYHPQEGTRISAMEDFKSLPRMGIAPKKKRLFVFTVINQKPPRNRKTEDFAKLSTIFITLDPVSVWLLGSVD